MAIFTWAGLFGAYGGYGAWVASRQELSATVDFFRPVFFACALTRDLRQLSSKRNRIRGAKCGLKFCIRITFTPVRSTSFRGGVNTSYPTASSSLTLEMLFSNYNLELQCKRPDLPAQKLSTPLPRKHLFERCYRIAPYTYYCISHF